MVFSWGSRRRHKEGKKGRLLPSIFPCFLFDLVRDGPNRHAQFTTFMDAFLFYAYWNGAQMRDLFEALVSITSRGTYAEMAALFFLIGIIIVLAVGATRHEGRPAIAYFACAVLFWCVSVVPRVSVSVVDVRTESVYTVDNVPLGIGFFGSLASRTGYWMAELYESAFAPVEVASFMKFGAVYPERVLEVLQSVGPITVEGIAATKAVLEGCVVPEILTDEVKAAGLVKSVDLWKDVSAAGWVNPARLAAMPSGKVLRCPEAMAEADEVLRTIELPAVKAKLGARLAPDHVSPSAVIASAIPQAESLLLNLSRTMDATLKHSLMRTAIPAAVESRAAASDGPLAAAVTLARAQGNLASEINYRTMAKIAQEALPKIRNALEFVVFATFPVVVLIALVAGSAMGAIVRSYLTLLVTIELWPALSSVVNYLMIACDAHPFGAIASQFGGDTLQAVSLIRETGATSQAIAGALMCAVPVIAYALVRAGDMAVGQLVGGITAPAASAASSQGAALAAGNISQGNVQTGTVHSNTTTANKHDRSIAVSHPGTLVSTSSYGTVTRSESGVVTGMSRTGINLGVSTSTSQSFARGHASSNLSQISSLWTDAARFSFTQSAASTDGTQRSFAHALHDALQNEMGYGTTHSASTHSSTSVGVSRGVEVSSADNVSEVITVGSDGGLGVNHVSASAISDAVDNVVRPNPLQGVGKTLVNADGGDGRTGTGGGEASFTRSVTGRLVSKFSMEDAQSLVDQATARSGTTTSSDQGQAYALVRNAAERVATTHRDESVRNAARTFASSLNAMHLSGRDEARALASSLTAASTVTQNTTAQSSTVVDGSIGVMNEALRRFTTPEAALREMFASSAQGMQLGGDIADAKKLSVSPQDQFGPGTMVSAVEMNVPLLDQAKSDLERTATEFSARVPQSLPALDVGEVGSSEAVQADVTARRQEVVGQMDTQKANLDFERGLLLVSRDAYAKENDSKNFALRNAFLFAWGYRSGEQIQEDMRQRAEVMPELRESLIRVGRSHQSHLDDKDWRGLIELARQPRGIGGGSR